ncbi:MULTISPECIES: hypothetical protein [unclassified Rathayibacter]|uniref:hypothetical protein n=1 Tax=unclassified Rathayibacter TaxID=2609250 RepID=UPI0006F28D77|nr:MULTISPECIES: hypothetical protein [unclassified Rathayibacter]KQQ03375.1 hypothetical protein ASF42_07550 [Rathayibacter sp. Leaf294]KQS11830.1 hypothetical protein ASG06_07550 [Rathayibacter sp. Leaf185]
MGALISTTPAPARGRARSGATTPFPISATSGQLTLLHEETARETRFWQSYDTDPTSTTAWADAATTAWRSPAAAARAEKDIDRWNDEGGSDPF